MVPWHPWICNNIDELEEKHIENTAVFRQLFVFVLFFFSLVLDSFAVFQGCLVDSILNSLFLIVCLVLNIYTWFLILGTFGEIDRLSYIHSTTLHDTIVHDMKINFCLLNISTSHR